MAISKIYVRLLCKYKLHLVHLSHIQSGQCVSVVLVFTRNQKAIEMASMIFDVRWHVILNDFTYGQECTSQSE